MKIGSARNEPIAPVRRGATAQAAAAVAATVARGDTVEILGIPQAEMTPSVMTAIQTLLAELDALRRDVAQLKARLAEAEETADRDPLTYLYNRRAFLRELNRARAFAERYGTPASLVYFDLDGFKEINDRFGHAAGDAALRAVAQRLTAHTRESDVVGRMGGDEFAVVLVQADQATAEAKAAVLANEIEAEPVNVGEAAATIRASYGVREVSVDMASDDIIDFADKAMFAAKRTRKAG